MYQQCEFHLKKYVHSKNIFLQAGMNLALFYAFQAG